MCTSKPFWGLQNTTSLTFWEPFCVEQQLACLPYFLFWYTSPKWIYSVEHDKIVCHGQTVLEISFVGLQNTPTLTIRKLLFGNQELSCHSFISTKYRYNDWIRWQTTAEYGGIMCHGQSMHNIRFWRLILPLLLGVTLGTEEHVRVWQVTERVQQVALRIWKVALRVSQILWWSGKWPWGFSKYQWSSVKLLWGSSKWLWGSGKWLWGF